MREPAGQTLPTSSPRKIPCIAAATAMALGALAATATAATPVIPVGARPSQAGRQLILSLRTTGRVALAKLDRQPSGRGTASLCFELRAAQRSGARRLCLGGPKRPRRRAGLLLLNAADAITDRRPVAVRVKRPSEEKLVVALLPAAAGLNPGRYRWRVLSDSGRCAAGSSASCEASLPESGYRRFRLRPVRPVGCSGGESGVIRNGSRSRDVVALTFDDGPSEYTPGFLRVLREKHVPGTFFEVGQEMVRHPATMRAILRQGGEIANHTMHHTEFPGYSSIAPATSLVESIAHFRPCLFRPPGGAVDSAVTAAAAADGLETVTWDVDPSDWSTPGSAAVYSRVVGATRPGSIVLMHDGGGPRGETLAALPSIIDTLRARGYRFATVTQLLGQRMIYRPYG